MQETNTLMTFENLKFVNNVLKECLIAQKKSKDFPKEHKNFEKSANIFRIVLYLKKQLELKELDIKPMSIDSLELFNFLHQLYEDKDFIRKFYNENEIIETKNFKMLAENKKIINTILRKLVEQKLSRPELLKNTKKSDLKEDLEAKIESFKRLSDSELFSRLRYLDISNKLLTIQMKDSKFVSASDVSFTFKNIFQPLFKKYDPQKILEFLSNVAETDKKFLKLLAATSAGSFIVSAPLSVVFDEPFLKTAAMLSTGNLALAAFSETFIRKKDVLKFQYELKEQQLYHKFAARLQFEDQSYKEFVEMIEKGFHLTKLSRKQLKNYKSIFETFAEIQTELNSLKAEYKELRRVARQNDTQYSLSPIEQLEFNDILSNFPKFSESDKNQLLMIFQSKDQTLIKNIKDFSNTYKILNKSSTAINSFDELITLISAKTAQDYLMSAMNNLDKHNIHKHQKFSALHT